MVDGPFVNTTNNNVDHKWKLSFTSKIKSRTLTALLELNASYFGLIEV